VHAVSRTKHIHRPINADSTIPEPVTDRDLNRGRHRLSVARRRTEAPVAHRRHRRAFECARTAAARERDGVGHAIGGDAQQQAAQAERERADANASRKAVRGETAKSSTQAAKPRLANRGPEPVAGIRPEYPPAAYRAGEEGSVLVRADVDASGVPGNVSLVRRSGSRDLDRAAVDAVRASHFRPAIRDGQAVASSIEVPVDFRLAER
jgi:TonB family protein